MQQETEIKSKDTRRGTSQFVCFKLSNEEYAIDIVSLQEVIRVPRITPVPQMPLFAMGVINIRGNVVATFDLRRLFHLPEKEFDANTKVLVVNVNYALISFVVDEILDNVKLEASQIDPTPTVKMKINRYCIQGLGALDGRMIAILDLPKVHGVIKDEIAKITLNSATTATL